MGKLDLTRHDAGSTLPNIIRLFASGMCAKLSALRQLDSINPAAQDGAFGRKWSHQDVMCRSERRLGGYVKETCDER